MEGIIEDIVTGIYAFELPNGAYVNGIFVGANYNNGTVALR